MFDIGWSELLIVGIVALVVVGPKDLPVLLRTVGKYMGMLRKQAGEFRTQFDEAMREAELDQLRKDVTQIKSETEATLRDTVQSASPDVPSLQTAVATPAEVAPAPLPATSGAAAAAAAAAAASPPVAQITNEQKTGA
jgi:sec-independent protein translocase protein TatB